MKCTAAGGAPGKEPDVQDRGVCCFDDVFPKIPNPMIVNAEECGVCVGDCRWWQVYSYVSWYLKESFGATGPLLGGCHPCNRILLCPRSLYVYKDCGKVCTGE